MKAVRAIIWKEMRENAKWAEIAAVFLGLLYPYYLYTWSMHSSGAVDPAFARTMLSWTVVAGPLFGTILGLLQIIPELRRDQWAFLIHRPAPRTTLFFGKVVACLILYTCALGIPFVCGAVWLAMPGHVAGPWIPQFALAGVADLLTGIVFYFAGMLAALQPIHRFGARPMGFFVALTCLAVVQYVTEFWQALLAITVTAAMLLAAACGSFIAASDYKRQPVLARAGLAGTLYIGFVVTILFTTIGLIQQIDKAPDAVWSSYNRVTRGYQIDQNGKIFVVSSTMAGVNDTRAFEDKPLTTMDTWKTAEAGKPLIFSTLYAKDAVLGLTYRSEARYLHPVSEWSQDVWYYNYVTGRILRYSRLTGRLLGSLGPDGFSRSTTGPGFAPVADQLIGTSFSRGDSSEIIPGKDGLFAVEFDNLSVRRLASIAASDQIRGITGAPANWTPDADLPLVYLTNSQIHALSNGDQPLFTIPVTFNMRAYQTIRVAQSYGSKHLFIWYYPGPLRNAGSPQAQQIVEVSETGREIARHTLPPLSNSYTEPASEMAFGVPVPPAVTAAFALYIAATQGVPNGLAASFIDAVAHHGLPVVSFSIVCVVTGLICALLAYLLGLRHGWDKRGRLAWAIGVFWLGIPGLLMLLALDRWPVRETCPSCGRKRVVTRETCEHCGSAWPAPQRNGTEIFELEAAA